MVLEHLEPRIVWDIFENLVAATPRPSKHEEKIREEIIKWIKKQNELHGFNFQLLEDDVGNILIKKLASVGHEESNSILFQAHLDMVCESNRHDGFDFLNSGIPLKIQENNEWIEADGTTLGADDGIGIALALALLIENEKNFPHGPIEVLFTVNEEDGFTGATGLDVEKLEIKSKYMINLDSGGFGEITIGSVCGRRVRFLKNFKRISVNEVEKKSFYEISVNGLLSGHSGGDIHLPRANANKLISTILSKVNQEIPLFIGRWKGGTAGNVIAAKSKVIIGINHDLKKQFEQLVNDEFLKIDNYFRKFEPQMEINFKAVPPEDYFSTEDSNLIISTAHIIPHGVIRMSNIYEGFVETSNNFAIVDEEEEGILFWLYPRSIIRDELDSFCVSMLQLGKLGGWEMYLRPVLPEWLPDLNSSFLAFVKEIYEDILQEPVKTNVVHGGLETGTISKKLPGIEMVALCPRIEGNHSPNERLNISDVGMIYRLLKKVLLEFSRLK